MLSSGGEGCSASLSSVMGSSRFPPLSVRETVRSGGGVLSETALSIISQYGGLSVV